MSDRFIRIFIESILLILGVALMLFAGKNLIYTLSNHLNYFFMGNNLFSSSLNILLFVVSVAVLFRSARFFLWRLKK